MNYTVWDSPTGQLSRSTVARYHYSVARPMTLPVAFCDSAETAATLAAALNAPTLSADGQLLAAIAAPLDDVAAGNAARLAVGDIAGLYLDHLAAMLDTETDPQRINTIKRVAGNVQALAGL
ncbi:MAG TPA: hypothetical protein VF680_17485 [Allosphingosinicella sp.]|jgi:hypothetical protein